MVITTLLLKICHFLVHQSFKEPTANGYSGSTALFLTWNVFNLQKTLSPDLMHNPTPSGTKQTSHLLSCISVNIHSQTQFTLRNCKTSVSIVVKSESSSLCTWASQWWIRAKAPCILILAQERSKLHTPGAIGLSHNTVWNSTSDRWAVFFTSG